MTRLLLVVAWLPILANCSGSAASLGLTGAPPAAVPVPASDADIGTPGVQAGAGPYTPSLVPSTGPGHYFGYGE